MEFLGHCSKNISKNAKNKKWNSIDLEFEDSATFCEATSKLINGFKDECRFVIADEYSERHFVDVLDYRFNSSENIIRIFPESCKQIKK